MPIFSLKTLQDLTKRTFPCGHISDWKLFSVETIDCFKYDANFFASIIPSNFSLNSFHLDNKRISKAVEIVKFKVEVLDCLARNDVQRLFEYEEKILDCMRINEHFLSRCLLKDITILMKKVDVQRAITFVIELLRLPGFNRLNREIAEIVHVAMFPTIFDEFKPALTQINRKGSFNEDRGQFVNPKPAIQGNIESGNDLSVEKDNGKYTPLKDEDWKPFTKYLESSRNCIKMLRFDLYLV